ncbi:MAG: macrocin O-methyltransferase [Elusimicrobia bacterium]|nr:macrocin O-methyltransferase [Elusimicrobiota bacterium]
MKTIAKALLRAANIIPGLFGFELRALRKGRMEVFDTHMLRSYYEVNPIMRLYREALRRCKGEASDNIYKQFRFYAYAQLAEYAAKALPDKDFAECGCWKGHSTRMIATIMKEAGARGRFLVFDSFEGGLSEFGADDVSMLGPMTPEQIKVQRELFRSGLDEVKGNLSEFDFIDYYAGWIPERFAEAAGREFAFVNIDVDLAAPVRDSLQFFYPRLARGGVMTFDEYGYTYYPGVKKEVDLFLANEKPQFFFELPSGGAFLIK